MSRKKILVFHSWGIGDLVMATPMLQSLYQNSYDVDLLLTSKAGASLVGKSPFLKNVFIITSLPEIILFALRHRKKYYAIVVTSGTNQKKSKLLAFLIKSKLYSKSINPKIHRIKDNIQNVSALITHQVLTPSITLPSSAAWKENYIKPNGFNIGFAVGSGKAQKFKRWDFNNFVDLAKRLQADNINCLLIIGPDEVDLHQKAQVENIQIVEESLLQTALVISKLNMLVGNDNGMMHIGYATNITTLTIFGMTDERIIGGYNDRNHVFSLPMECRPCFRSEVGKIKCDNTVCLSNIDVDSVYKKIKKLCIDKKL